MSAVKKSIIILLACLAGGLLLFSALAPSLFPQRVIQEKIAGELSRLLQTDVAVEAVSLTILLTPGVTLRGVSCDLAGGTALQIKKITVRPDLLALFSGKLRIKSITVRSPEAIVRLHHDNEPRPGPAGMPSFADLQMQAARALAAVAGSLPSGSCVVENGTARFILRDGAQLDLSGIDLRAAAAQQRLTLSAECTSALWEKLTLTGAWGPRDSAGSAQALSMTVRVTEVNVAACKKMAPALAGPRHPVAALCERVREGRIPELSLSAEIPFPCADALIKHISAQASAEAMTISLPENGPEVNGLSAALSFRGGLLEARSLAARVGNSRVSDGVLSLDSAAGFSPVLLQGRISADFTDLPRLLHLVPSPAVRAELELIKKPSGSADAAVTVRRGTGGYSTEVAIADLALRGDYRSFPMPLALERGTCTCSTGVLAFKDFSGKLGDSALPAVSASFSIGEDERFSASVRGASVALPDLAAVFGSFDATKAFIAPVTQAAGSAQVQDAAVSGPLSSPAAWNFSLSGSLRDAAFSFTGFEGIIDVPSAAVALDRSRISFSPARLRFLDAALSGSLLFEGYLGNAQKTTAEAAGKIGEKSIAQAAAYLGVPSDFLLRAPVALEKATFTRQQGGATTVTADLRFAENTRASLDLRARPAEFEIRRLKIRGEASECEAGLGIRDDLFTVAYRGFLDKTTLDRILADNRLVQGWIRGDFRAAFNEKEPLASSAAGTLQWNNAGSGGLKQFPMCINSASLTATGRDLRVDEARITAGKTAAAVGGSLRFDERGFNLDLDVSTDSIDLDRDAGLFSRDPATSNGGDEEFWDTPLRGIVRLRARELIKGPVTLSPFHSDITFADRKIAATAADVRLCGIALPGSLQITPGVIALAARPVAQEAELKKVVSCLTGEKSIITGALDVQGELAGKGRASEIGSALAGPVTITCRQGRIYKSNLFTKILSFLSIRKLLSGGMSDVTRKGFGYRLLEIHGEVQGDAFIVRDATLDSDPLALVCRGSINLKDKSLDLTALATPFQMPDIGLKAVPVVGTFFSKKRIGVPIKISGNIDDAKLSPGLPAAIEKDLVGVVKKIVKLPVEIIDLPALMFENNKEEKSRQ